MAEQNFAVNYKINVVDNGSKSIKNFTDALATLPKGDPFKELNASLANFQREIASAKASLKSIGKTKAKRINITFTPESWQNIEQAKTKLKGISANRSISISVNAQNAHRSIDKLEARLKKLCDKAYTISISANTPTNSSKASSSRATTATTTAAVNRAVSRVTSRGVRPSGTFRSIMGPTYLNSGPNFAQEMVKGMGMAYGMQAIFSGISQVVKDAISYQNISQTTRNILGANDRRRDFASRFDEMNYTLRDVGVKTRFTAPEVASAGKFLAMAGQNVDEIKGSIRSIANLALIGDTDLGQTADVTTNIMSGFGLKAAQMDRAADILTRTFTMSNTTLMELSESFKYVGSIAKQAGLRFEDVSAAAGVLGNAGIKGSAAGTALRNIIFNILAPTKKQAEAWAATGIKRTDENGQMRSLSDIFADLDEYSKNFSGEGKTALYSALFFKRAGTAAAALASHSGDISRISEAATGSAGLSRRLAWAKNNLTVEGNLAQTKSAFTEAGIQAFTAIQSTIIGLLRDLTEKFKSPEFAAQLKSGMEFFVDMIKTLIDAISTIGSMWANTPNWLKSAFKTFVAVQMWMRIVFSPIKAIASMLTPISVLLTRTGVLGGMALSGGGAAAAAGATNAAIMSTGMMAATATGPRWTKPSGIGALRADGNTWVRNAVQAHRNHFTSLVSTPSRYPHMFAFAPNLAVPQALSQSETNAMLNKQFRKGNTTVSAKAWRSANEQLLRSKQSAYLKKWRSGISYAPWGGVPYAMPLGAPWASQLTPVLTARSVEQTKRFGSALSVLGKAGGVAKKAIGGLFSVLGLNPWVIAVAGVGMLAYKMWESYKAGNAAAEALSKMSEQAKTLSAAEVDWSESNSVMLQQMGLMSSSLLTQSEKLQRASDLWKQYWKATSGEGTKAPDTKMRDVFTPFGKVADSRSGGLSDLFSMGYGKTQAEAQQQAAILGIDWNQMPKILGAGPYSSTLPLAVATYAYAHSGNNENIKAAQAAIVNLEQSYKLGRVKDIKGEFEKIRKQFSISGTGNKNYSPDATLKEMQGTMAFISGNNAAINELVSGALPSYLNFSARGNKNTSNYGTVNNQAAADWIYSSLFPTIKPGTKWGSGEWRAGMRKLGDANNVSAIEFNKRLTSMWEQLKTYYDQITDPESQGAILPFVTDTRWWQSARSSNNVPLLDIGLKNSLGGAAGGTQSWKAPSQDDAKIKGYGATPKQIIVNIENLMKIDKIDATDERKMAAISNLKQELAQALVSVVSDVDDEWGRGSTGL